jgi:hypothetical protein
MTARRELRDGSSDRSTQGDGVPQGCTEAARLCGLAAMHFMPVPLLHGQGHAARLCGGWRSFSAIGAAWRALHRLHAGQ